MSLYRIVHAGVAIGTTRLEERDDGMGTASGQFMPGPGYEKVSEVFQLFARAIGGRGADQQAMLADYYRRRDELALSVVSEHGDELPVSTIHIEDYSDELGAEGLHIEVHFEDRSFFERGF